jgi:hypothetical protein
VGSKLLYRDATQTATSSGRERGSRGWYGGAAPSQRHLPPSVRYVDISCVWYCLLAGEVCQIRWAAAVGTRVKWRGALHVITRRRCVREPDSLSIFGIPAKVPPTISPTYRRLTLLFIRVLSSASPRRLQTLPHRQAATYRACSRVPYAFRRTPPPPGTPPIQLELSARFWSSVGSDLSLL